MPVAKDLEVGSYFLQNNELMKVVRKELVAYGTHSHTKLKITAQSLFSKVEKIFTFGHNDKVEMEDVTRKEAQVISKPGDKIQIMDTKSYETFDANCDKELFDRINNGDIVTFIEFRGQINIIEKR